MIGPLRVGIVCPYSFAVPGGVQFHIRDFGRELERRGHHVEVLAPGIVADGTPDFVRGSGRSIALPYNGSIARIAFTPGSARTPMGARKAASQPGYTTVVPLGLLRSLAILLTVLLVESPIEHVMPRASTERLMRAQTSTGSSRENLPGVTSKYASSTLICSM